MANSVGDRRNPLFDGRRRSLLGRLVVLGLLATLGAGFLDHLGQAACKAAGPDRGAAVGAGVANRFQHPSPVGPCLALLARTAWSVFLGNAIALGLGPAGADHNLVVGRARA